MSGKYVVYMVSPNGQRVGKMLHTKLTEVEANTKVLELRGQGFAVEMKPEGRGRPVKTPVVSV